MEVWPTSHASGAAGPSNKQQQQGRRRRRRRQPRQAAVPTSIEPLLQQAAQVSLVEFVAAEAPSQGQAAPQPFRHIAASELTASWRSWPVDHSGHPMLWTAGRGSAGKSVTGRHAGGGAATQIRSCISHFQHVQNLAQNSLRGLLEQNPAGSMCTQSLTRRPRQQQHRNSRPRAREQPAYLNAAGKF